MKFNCDREPRVDQKKSWHVWFAWYPVKVGPGDCRWLEKVERRGQLDYFYDGSPYWLYEYRELVKPKNANIT